MRRRISPVLTAALLAATAAHAATVSMPIRITIIQPLIVTEIDTLDFGGVYAPTAGTVTIDPVAGTRTATGGAQFLTSTFSMGEFDVAGEANAPISIALPAGDVPLTSGANMVRLHSMTYHVVGGTSALDASGALSFRVGGTVDLAGTEPEGSYEGTYTVTVNYQ